MRRSAELDLETALRMNGVADVPAACRRVRVRVAPTWLIRTWRRGVDAMAMPDTLYLSPGAMMQVVSGGAGSLLLHESAHIEQWRRFGRAGFLVRYLGDYLRGRAVGLPPPTAYRSIRFEREARERAERL